MKKLVLKWILLFGKDWAHEYDVFNHFRTIEVNDLRSNELIEVTRIGLSINGHGRLTKKALTLLGERTDDE